MNRLLVRRFMQVAVGTLVLAIMMFISSGRTDWVWAWAFIAVSIGAVVVNTELILPSNPELIGERAEAKENTKGWDRTFTRIFIIPYFATPIIAGLDVRFGWSPQFALVTQLVALVIVIGGYGLVSWAMVSNVFFSRTVRIQEDRGYTVATADPYQYLRHPGYVGMLAYSLAAPLLLGSFWALIPVIFVAYGFIIRTSLEDKTLQEELDGYRDYAQHVKYRLIPKIW